MAKKINLDLFKRKIIINMTNRSFYSLIAFGVLILLCAGFFVVNAYGTNNPAVFGHSAGEIEGGGASLWSASGSNIYYSGGNVGIGTSSPVAGSKLDVNGIVVGEGFSTRTGKAYVFETGGKGRIVGDEVCIGGDCKTSWPSGGGSLWSSSGSNIYYSGGRVGIGTSSPGYTLDVRGKSYFSGKVGIGRTPSATYTLHVAGSSGFDTLWAENIGCLGRVSTVKFSTNTITTSGGAEHGVMWTSSTWCPCSASGATALWKSGCPAGWSSAGNCFYILGS